METNKLNEEQSVFETIRQQNLPYVDKTELVYNLTQEYSYAFLSRPRGFGKTLLCTTLKSYFEGKKELFKGLALEKLEKDWTKHPVIYLNMSVTDGLDVDALETHIGTLLEPYEKKYNITPNYEYCGSRISKIIREAHEQENQRVAVLIDNYDSPLLEVNDDEEKLKSVSRLLFGFYCNLKSSCEHVDFVFLTGTTRFGLADSFLGGLNNLSFISMRPNYAAICGITEEELQTQLSPQIDKMAEAKGETREETIAELRKMYGGYHFTYPSPDIYNPYSLINALSDKTRDSYWFGSGTPTYLIEMLRKFKVLPTNIGNVKAFAKDFDVPTNQIDNIIPLLYQSGYLTIKNCNAQIRRYTLDIPNKEVRDGLMDSLLPYYVTPALQTTANNIVGDMAELIFADDMDSALKILKEFLTGVPYVDFLKSEKEETPEDAQARKVSDYEGNYQQMLYIIFSLLGCYVNTEIRTAQGRIDMVIESDTRIYVTELKMNKNVQSALTQIDKKQYPAKYSNHPLPVYKLAITFNINTRTLDCWQLQQA